MQILHVVMDTGTDMGTIRLVMDMVTDMVTDMDMDMDMGMDNMDMVMATAMDITAVITADSQRKTKEKR